jgi:hypothetical protein
MILKNNNILIKIIILELIISISGCYSFTGGSLPSHLKTIYIPYAEDQTLSGEPNLKEFFTESIIQKFRNDNTLQISDQSNANCRLDCVIISLNDSPAIIEAKEAVATRRISITVKAVFRDLLYNKAIFEKNFNSYVDYNSQNAVLERSEAIKKTLDFIAEDILFETISNW